MRRSAPRHVRCVAPGVGGQWHRGTKQQHSTPGDIERKTSEGLTPEQAGAWRGNRGLTAWPVATAAGRNSRSRRSVS
jgi:hypothetical protein